MILTSKNAIIGCSLSSENEWVGQRRKQKTLLGLKKPQQGWFRPVVIRHKLGGLTGLSVALWR
jgi:hypothetical protein